jgi:hypothetical protein
MASFATAVLIAPSIRAQAPAAGARFVDNGNDTVTDTQTGLMWEKQTTAVGSGENPRDPRDVDNTYTWEYAVGDWIDKMNGRLIANVNDGSFAGYTDWRVPTMAELQTIVDTAQPTRVNPVFGANALAPYWSSSRREFGSTPNAWYVLFGPDIPVSVGVPFKFHVRAVRGGRR